MPLHRTTDHAAARFSVIVPTWNEGANLPRALASVRRAIPGAEIIVADAGSSDRTAATAEEFGARVVHCPVRNRSHQMNLGAEAASGSVLLFLHADTVLPGSGGGRIAAALRSRRKIVGGAFARRFDSRSRFLGLTCRLANLRGQLFGVFLGDQAIFIRTKIFRALGGYESLRCFEDLDFSLRMRRQGPVALLAGPVLSSGRRFHRLGPVARTACDILMTLHYCINPRAYRFRAPGTSAIREAEPDKTEEFQR